MRTVTKMATTQTTKQWESLYLEIPLNGATAKYEDYILTVTGPKGETSKMLKYPYVSIKVEDDKIVVGTDAYSRRQNKIIKTFRAHIKNLIEGVTNGFEYKLKVVYAKFPITVELKGQTFAIKNLLGEKVPRTLEIPQDVKVNVSGADVSVSGINKERCGQVAASLEQLAKITHLDRRVVQDGLFITEKPHVKYV